MHVHLGVGSARKHLVFSAEQLFNSNVHSESLLQQSLLHVSQRLKVLRINTNSC